jgi:hypothetical protein
MQTAPASAQRVSLRISCATDSSAIGSLAVLSWKVLQPHALAIRVSMQCDWKHTPLPCTCTDQAPLLQEVLRAVALLRSSMQLLSGYTLPTFFGLNATEPAAQGEKGPILAGRDLSTQKLLSGNAVSPPSITSAHQQQQPASVGYASRLQRSCLESLYSRAMHIALTLLGAALCGTAPGTSASAKHPGNAIQQLCVCDDGAMRLSCALCASTKCCRSTCT